MSANTETHTKLNRDDRHAMVSVAAYYLSEQRGFAPGQADRDWLLAEEQIDCMLDNLRRAGMSLRLPQEIGLRNALRLWGG